ncbi:hypothetical protein CLOP_g7468 [Closterium sp. NIES-67]|nr:hypothetical protein CLOP_g7468 [Closterium sp. NIES-67]
MAMVGNSGGLEPPEVRSGGEGRRDEGRESRGEEGSGNRGEVREEDRRQGLGDDSRYGEVESGGERGRDRASREGEIRGEEGLGSREEREEDRRQGLGDDIRYGETESGGGRAGDRARGEIRGEEGGRDRGEEVGSPFHSNQLQQQQQEQENPQQQQQQQQQEPISTGRALAGGVGAAVQACGGHVAAALHSQERLDAALGRLAAELDGILEGLPMPVMPPCTTRIAAMQRRVHALNSSLSRIHTRIETMKRHLRFRNVCGEQHSDGTNDAAQEQQQHQHHHGLPLLPALTSTTAAAASASSWPAFTAHSCISRPISSLHVITS